MSSDLEHWFLRSRQDVLSTGTVQPPLSCMYTRMHAQIHTNTHTHTSLSFTYTHTHTHTHTHTFLFHTNTHTLTHAHSSTCTHNYILTHLATHTHKETQTHIQTQTHTHTHTHTHIYIYIYIHTQDTCLKQVPHNPARHGHSIVETGKKKKKNLHRVTLRLFHCQARQCHTTYGQQRAYNYAYKN